jgi:hypothetical protein
LQERDWGIDPDQNAFEGLPQAEKGFANAA